MANRYDYDEAMDLAPEAMATDYVKAGWPKRPWWYEDDAEDVAQPEQDDNDDD